VKLLLATDILNISADLDVRWGLGVSLVNEDDTGKTLSTLGQAFYRGAIYSVQAMAPSLFPLAIRNIDIDDRTWTNDYAEELEDQYSGSWVETAKAAGGDLFGVTYDLLSLIILVFFLVGIIIADMSITNDYWNGLVDAAFILVIASKISLIGLGYVALIAAVCIIYIGTRLFGILKG
jgi:hypothetical protein